MSLDQKTREVLKRFEKRNSKERDEKYTVGDLEFNKESIDGLIKISNQNEYTDISKPHIQDIIELAKAIGAGRLQSADEFAIKLAAYIEKHRGTPELDITVEKLCADECLGAKDVAYLKDRIDFLKTHKPAENATSEPLMPAKDSDHGGAASEDFYVPRTAPESEPDFYRVGSLQFPRANIDALIENIGHIVAQAREISTEQASIKVKEYQKNIYKIARDIKEGKYGADDGEVVKALQGVIKSAEEGNQKDVNLERLCAADCFNIDVKEVRKLIPSKSEQGAITNAGLTPLSSSGTATATISPAWTAGVSASEVTHLGTPQITLDRRLDDSYGDAPTSEKGLANEEDVRELYEKVQQTSNLFKNYSEHGSNSIITLLEGVVNKVNSKQSFTKEEAQGINSEIDAAVAQLIHKLNEKHGLEVKGHDKDSAIGAALKQVFDKMRAETNRSARELKGAVPRLEAVARNTTLATATALNGIPFYRRLTAEEAARESWGVGWTGIPPETASSMMGNKNERRSGFFTNVRDLAKKIKEVATKHKGKIIAAALAVLTAGGLGYMSNNKGDRKVSGPAIESPERPKPQVSAAPDLSSPGFEVSRLDGTYTPDSDPDKPNRRAAEDRESDNTPTVTEQMIKECQEGKYTYMIKCIREVVDGQKDPLKKKLTDILHTAAKERAQKEGRNFDTLSEKEKHAYVDAVIGGSGIKPPQGKDPKEWFRELKDKTPASYIANQLGLYSTTYSFTSDVNRNIQSLGVQIKMPGEGKKITPELVVEAINATLQK